MKNLYFLWQMVKQNYQEKNYEFQEPTLRREIHRKERESQRKISGKSFNLKKQKMTKESISFFGLTEKLGKNFIYRQHIEPRISIVRAEKRIISYSTEPY